MTGIKRRMLATPCRACQCKGMILDRKRRIMVKCMGCRGTGYIPQRESYPGSGRV